MKYILKVVGSGLIAFSLVALVATVVTAKPGNVPNGPAGKSEVSHLYLYEKDGEPDWNIVEDGAWGKMQYKEDSFVFNGHGLEPEWDYTLVRYLDPWPGEVVCLGSGVANEFGDVHIADEWMDGGPKVWLVLSNDVECGSGMTAWHGEEYLFEYDLIDGYIYVAFLQSGTHYDSWWETVDGVHHEYRADGYFQFHAESVDDCEGSYTWSSDWTFNGAVYEEVDGDVGDLRDFLNEGKTYHVCRYPAAI